MTADSSHVENRITLYESELVIENLKEMPWEEPFCGEDGLEFKKRIREELGLDTTIID